MSKYSFEFKKQVVNAYLNGEGGYTYLANKFGIPSDNNVKLWVDNYNAFGDEGLKRSRKKDFYSFEKKLSIVELYLSSEISYQDLALQEGITNPSMITNWVSRFRAAGPDALRPRKKGRKKTLNTTNGNTQNKPVEESSVDTSVDYVEELENELLKLRIGNDFLERLLRLSLEGEEKGRTVRIISSLRGRFKLKNLLTYLYSS